MKTSTFTEAREDKLQSFMQEMNERSLSLKIFSERSRCLRVKALGLQGIGTQIVEAPVL